MPCHPPILSLVTSGYKIRSLYFGSSVMDLANVTSSSATEIFRLLICSTGITIPSDYVWLGPYSRNERSQLTVCTFHVSALLMKALVLSTSWPSSPFAHRPRSMSNSSWTTTSLPCCLKKLDASPTGDWTKRLPMMFASLYQSCASDLACQRRHEWRMERNNQTSTLWSTISRFAVVCPEQ